MKAAATTGLLRAALAADFPLGTLASRRIILLKLAQRAGSDDVCRLPVGSLAAATNFRGQVVREALADLVTIGHVSIIDDGIIVHPRVCDG